MGVEVEGRVAETVDRRERSRSRRFRATGPPRGEAPLGRVGVREGEEGVEGGEVPEGASSRSEESSSLR